MYFSLPLLISPRDLNKRSPFPSFEENTLSDKPPTRCRSPSTKTNYNHHLAPFLTLSAYLARPARHPNALLVWAISLERDSTDGAGNVDRSGRIPQPLPTLAAVNFPEPRSRLAFLYGAVKVGFPVNSCISRLNISAFELASERCKRYISRTWLRSFAFRNSFTFSRLK